MSARNTILEWTENGSVKDARAALEIAGVLPGAREWRGFLDRLLLWSGAVCLAAAVVYFVAHNWSQLGRFAKFALVESLLALAVFGYCRLGPARASGKASLLVASLLVGALLALFGQTYQTGADTWQLFAMWAALIAAWVLISRFAALWLVWIAIVNVAVVLYFSVFPGFFGAVFATEDIAWTLFVCDTVALVVWELAARRVPWLDERWAARLLAVASGTAVTLLALHAIFDRGHANPLTVPVYLAWLAAVYAAYRRHAPDVLVLAGACLSLIVVVTAFLARNVFVAPHEAGAFLFIAIVVIGMAAAAGWWLKHVAQELRG